MKIIQTNKLSRYYGKGKIKAVGESDCEVYERETSGLSGSYRARETTVNSLNCTEEKDSLKGRDT